MKLSRLKLFTLCLIFTPFTHAEVSRIRASASAGFGQAQVKDQNYKSADLQGPISNTFTVDYSANGESEWGVEHKRTWSARSGTAVGLTGLTYKNFFWHSRPQIESVPFPRLPRGQWDIHAISPYIGASAGIGQASIIDKKMNAIGFYLGVTGGLDWYSQRNWGLRMEASGSATLGGQGRIDTVSAGLGIYLNL
ncbi:MAG: hypothetical protein RJB66_1851 [Pseudomonadota bacterium]|jgi:hypothetical protein